MNVAFRPAGVNDLGYCERLYLAGMDYIIRALQLDPDAHVKSFRRQLGGATVRIIALDGADVGWLQTMTDRGAAYEGRGIGRKLLPLACETLRQAGYRSATLVTEPSTRAETFYRRDGWIEIGRESDGQIIFQKEI